MNPCLLLISFPHRHRKQSVRIKSRNKQIILSENNDHENEMNRKETYFTVKSIKVNWDNAEDS
jgi:hypothetical protein